MAIVSYTTEELKKMKSKTDWERVKRDIDNDIVDYSDIPELTGEWFANAARPGRPKKAEPKENISLRLSAPNLEFLRKSKGWQTRIDDLITGWRLSSQE